MVSCMPSREWPTENKLKDIFGGFLFGCFFFFFLTMSCQSFPSLSFESLFYHLITLFYYTCICFCLSLLILKALCVCVTASSLLLFWDS